MRGDAVQGRNGDKAAQLARDFERIKEAVETMTGERGASKKPLSFVRRGEFSALASTPMQSSQITAAPTQANYNALQADVKTIYDMLAKISNVLGTATIPKV